MVWQAGPGSLGHGGSRQTKPQAPVRLLHFVQIRAIVGLLRFPAGEHHKAVADEDAWVQLFIPEADLLQVRIGEHRLRHLRFIAQVVFPQLFVASRGAEYLIV